MRFETNGKQLSFEEPQIMAILNLTPNSFYDGGKYSVTEDVLKDAEQKLAEGAHILDLGAVSTRPGAQAVSEAEELDRLLPVLKGLRQLFPDQFISIDTYRATVARQAVEAGADIINDISGGDMDPEMFVTMARLNVPYILMHMQGQPQTMQDNPQYGDVLQEVRETLARKARLLREQGFEKIILDPGFGFGKTVEHNYHLLKHLAEFAALGYPVLAGLSRKSMINKVLGTSPVTALNGTTVVNTLALLNGASILRVHDVKEARQAIQLMNVYNKA